MNAVRKRLWIWSAISLVVTFGLLVALWPRPLYVDVATVTTGPMMLTVGDEGETQVIDVFVVSSPIAGTLRRIEAEPGNAVIASETIVAEIEPLEAQLLDPRTEAEAESQIGAAEAASLLAEAELDSARAELRFAESELRRTRELAGKGTVSQRDVEASERAFSTSRAAIGIAQANMQVRQFELERARAQLLTPEEMASRRDACECITLSSPVDGRILQVLRESEGFVRAGEGLIEIGNPDRLEIIVDLLSIDAVKVKTGDSALIENWGGAGALNARVRQVEPFGYTRVSALGIEEQRVNVVLDIVSPRDEWQALGHGYQVEVQIILWSDDNVLKVPLTALFRDGERWAIFVNENGKAAQRVVEIGHRTSSESQILSGLTAEEEIVVYPGEGIVDGVRIAPR